MDSEQGVKAALTKEEWERGVIWFRQPWGEPAERQSPTGFTADHIGWIGTYGVNVEDDGTMWVWDDSWALTVDDDTRHALAARCLYGQPYGFTWDHHFAVSHADEQWWRCTEGHWSEHIDENLHCYICSRPVRSIDEFVDEAANRIAALLPPRAAPNQARATQPVGPRQYCRELRKTVSYQACHDWRRHNPDTTAGRSARSSVTVGVSPSASSTIRSACQPPSSTGSSARRSRAR